MITVRILLDSIQKVKDFSAVVTKEDVSCELIEGVHIIDGRSIMGIFSLDLMQPVELKIHSDDRELLNKLKQFIVEE